MSSQQYFQKCLMLCLFGCISFLTQAQELYVFSEPASTMPARSIMLKQSFQQMNGSMSSTILNTQVELSLRKNWMLHLGTNYKSTDLYTQYRIYTKDAVHEHTRLALYAKAVESNENPKEQAVLLDGQQKLWGAGLIATRLQHKWAGSITIGWLHRYVGNSAYTQDAIQYGLSNGLLLFPVTYKSYKQTNINAYIELLGQQSVGNQTNYVDIAPAIQFIFNSQSKLNIGYRWPLWDTMHRFSDNSFYISIDHLFFNALPKHKQQR